MLHAVFTVSFVCAQMFVGRQVISLEFQTCSTHDHGSADCFVGYLILEFGFAATVSMENNWGGGLLEDIWFRTSNISCSICYTYNTIMSKAFYSVAKQH